MVACDFLFALRDLRLLAAGANAVSRFGKYKLGTADGWIFGFSRSSRNIWPLMTWSQCVNISFWWKCRSQTRSVSRNSRLLNSTFFHSIKISYEFIIRDTLLLVKLVYSTKTLKWKEKNDEKCWFLVRITHLWRWKHHPLGHWFLFTMRITIGYKTISHLVNIEQNTKRPNKTATHNTQICTENLHQLDDNDQQ